jgi:hypothetical protein
VLRLLDTANVPSSLILVNLIMEAIRSPEMLVYISMTVTVRHEASGSECIQCLKHFLFLQFHLISPTSGGRSVGIVRLRTKGHGVQFHFAKEKGTLCHVCTVDSGSRSIHSAHGRWR